MFVCFGSCSDFGGLRGIAVDQLHWWQNNSFVQLIEWNWVDACPAQKHTLAHRNAAVGVKA